MLCNRPFINRILHEAASCCLQPPGPDSLSGAEAITSVFYERPVNTIDAIDAVSGKESTWLSMMPANARVTAAGGMPALMASARWAPWAGR